MASFLVCLLFKTLFINRRVRLALDLASCIFFLVLVSFSNSDRMIKLIFIALVDLSHHEDWGH